MRSRYVISAERVAEVLRYDPDSCMFTWACDRPGGAKAGDEAGHLHSTGYRYIGIDGRRYRAHRLAWLIVHGQMPAGEIDHINGNPGDNRIANLRDVPRGVNAQNLHAALKSNKRSGLLGVSWHPQAQRWKAKLQTGGKAKHLGYFDTPEEAHAAYLAAKRAQHEGCTL